MLRPAAAPALSVVVVSFSRPLAMLARGLRAVMAQDVSGGVEIIVVRNWQEDDPAGAATLQAEFPNVVFVDTTDPTIPHMRRTGIARSRGDVIAVIEDDCVVDITWAAAVLRAHQGPDVAIGGAVEPGAYRTSLDWAAYFCDYARFMLPFRRLNTWLLAGNNVSYKRDIVPDLLALTAHDGLQEAFLHRSWHEAGKPMQTDPAIIVRNEHRWTMTDMVIVPFFHGRAFGGKRARDWRLERRALFVAVTAVLPLVHVGRVSHRVLRRRRFAGRLLRALPWISVFGVSWAAGECIGYAAGPGDSLRHWR